MLLCLQLIRTFIRCRWPGPAHLFVRVQSLQSQTTLMSPNVQVVLYSSQHLSQSVESVMKPANKRNDFITLGHRVALHQLAPTVVPRNYRKAAYRITSPSDAGDFRKRKLPFANTNDWYFKSLLAISIIKSACWRFPVVHHYCGLIQKLSNTHFFTTSVTDHTPLPSRPWMYHKNWIPDGRLGLQYLSSGHSRYCNKNPLRPKKHFPLRPAL